MVMMEMMTAMSRSHRCIRVLKGRENRTFALILVVSAQHLSSDIMNQRSVMMKTQQEVVVLVEPSSH